MGINYHSLVILTKNKEQQNAVHKKERKDLYY